MNDATGAIEYFLGEALGSVRQIADASGAVTLTQSFEPYGKVSGSEGTSSSIYGFDAEQTDSCIRISYLKTYSSFDETQN